MKTINITLLVLATVILTGCGMPPNLRFGGLYNGGVTPNLTPMPIPPTLDPATRTVLSQLIGKWSMCGDNGAIFPGSDISKDNLDRQSDEQRQIVANGPKMSLTLKPDGTFELVDFNLQTQQGTVSLQQNGRLMLIMPGGNLTWLEFDSLLNLLKLNQDDGHGNTMEMDLQLA